MPGTATSHVSPGALPGHHFQGINRIDILQGSVRIIILQGSVRIIILPGIVRIIILPWRNKFREQQMDFNKITGQREVIENLKRSLSEDRVSHAYIFSGPQGIGKKTIARIFAGLLLCDDPHDGATCGRCRACLLIENGTNPDLISVNADGSSIGVDQIRAIQGDAVLRPMYSRRKVYIVEDAVKMTVQAQNCLLKTFEEPPSYVIVILLTTNYESLLETVRSRALHMQLRKYTRDQVMQALRARIGGSRHVLELIAGYADGNIGQALKLAESSEFSMLRDRLFDLLPGVSSGRTKDIFELTAFLEDNRDNIDVLLDIMLVYYRDLLAAKECGESMLINSDKKDIILNNARNCRSSRIIECIEAVGAVRGALRQHANYQLAVDWLLIKLQGQNKKG
jgi:DNA polymerase-3 subunit delta'